MDRKPFQHRDKAFLLLDGLLVGALSGGVAVFYRYILGIMEDWRHLLFEWTSMGGLVFLIAAAVLSAIIVIRLLKWAPLSGGSGIPQVQGEILGIFRMSAFPVAVSKIIGGSLATLIGLALGREGPSIQIGAAMAKIFSKGVQRDKTKEKLLITAGAAAGLSAAFSAPLAGVLFSVEEIHKNTSKAMIAVTLTASIVANYIAAYVFKLTPVFSFTITELLPLKYYGHIIALGAITAVVGVLFCKGIVLGQRFYQRLPIPVHFRMIFVFLTAVLIGHFFSRYFGRRTSCYRKFGKQSGSCFVYRTSFSGKISIYLLFIWKRGSGRNLSSDFSHRGNCWNTLSSLYFVFRINSGLLFSEYDCIVHDGNTDSSSTGAYIVYRFSPRDEW